MSFKRTQSLIQNHIQHVTVLHPWAHSLHHAVSLLQVGEQCCIKAIRDINPGCGLQPAHWLLGGGGIAEGGWGGDGGRGGLEHSQWETAWSSYQSQGQTPLSKPRSNTLIKAKGRHPYQSQGHTPLSKPKADSFVLETFIKAKGRHPYQSQG